MTLEGTPLPGGRYRITAEQDAALREVLGGQAVSGTMGHPLFYYIASQVGMGLGVADLLAMCDFDVADGPMMTGSAVTFHEELRLGLDYDVAGEVVSLVRKPSRTFGALDLLTFRLTLSRDGTLAAECTNNWVLPRRGAASQ